MSLFPENFRPGSPDVLPPLEQMREGYEGDPMYVHLATSPNDTRAFFTEESCMKFIKDQEENFIRSSDPGKGYGGVIHWIYLKVKVE